MVSRRRRAARPGPGNYGFTLADLAARSVEARARAEEVRRVRGRGADSVSLDHSLLRWRAMGREGSGAAALETARRTVSGSFSWGMPRRFCMLVSLKAADERPPPS